MTKKEAIHILIKHASQDCQGAGCGPGHQVPSYEECCLVAKAIIKVWPETNHEPNFFNLGLPDPKNS